MKKNNDKLIIIILILVFIFVIYRSSDFKLGEDYRERMYYDFKNYGSAIEELNEKLSGILITEDYAYLNERLYINEEILRGFKRSKYDAGKIGKFDYADDYDNVYRRFNNNINNILQDGIISSSEKEYIGTLYDYNIELISEYKSILESSYGRFEDNSEKKIINKIIKIYDEFSNKADKILNTEYYSILKDYKGDFSNFDFKRTEKFVVDIFSKVVPGRLLNYNNKVDINADKFIFTTHEDGENADTGTVYQEPQYRIEYDKASGEVYLRLTGRTVPTYVLKEEEVDSIAEDILARLNYEGFLYERTVSNFNIPELSSITYSYINKIDDIWDQQQNIELELDSYGLVRQLYIVDRDNDKGLYFVDIKEILDKIHKEADVNDICKVKNIRGEAEYIVKISYKGINYDLVFDGGSGNLKKSKLES